MAVVLKTTELEPAAGVGLLSSRCTLFVVRALGGPVFSESRHTFSRNDCWPAGARAVDLRSKEPDDRLDFGSVGQNSVHLPDSLEVRRDGRSR